MMKRIISLLLVCLLAAGCAMAEDAGSEQAKESAKSLLTEVYGYTAREAEAFEMEAEADFDVWQVRFWPAEHPDWVYTAQFNRENGQFRHSATPFLGEDGFVYYPGESTVRMGLALAREKGWFTQWNQAAAQALLAWMLEQGLATDADVQSGLSTGSMSAGNALHAYFVCCYGQMPEWTDALQAWHDQELASYGLALEQAMTLPEGTMRYELAASQNEPKRRVVQFSGEAPRELAGVLAHPRLDGWQALCGVYFECESEREWDDDMGLIAFEKEGERLLVQMGRNAGEAQWHLQPVGYQALLKERDVYITCDPQKRLFNIVYPISELEDECFQVRCTTNLMEEELAMSCRFSQYSRINRADGSGIRIEPGGEGCNVTIIHADGTLEKENVEREIHQRFDLIEASAFPTTLEALQSLPEIKAPNGYGVATGPHLRAQTSSRSKDLGEYRSGVLVEILGEEDGDPYNWYKVRIGSMEGYMCSLYVDYEGSVCSMQPLTRSEPLEIAQTLQPVKLKSGIGWFARTVRELPAGTKMHVLAERGNWLHVMIPQGEIGWMMDIDGTDGYVRKEDVRTASSALQLEWME